MKSKSLLYKFWQKDDDIRHYIFGTLHLATSAAFAHSTIALEGIQNSAIYASEMDLSDSLSMLKDDYFKMKSGKSFSSLFEPKYYEKCQKRVLKYFGIDLKLFDEYTPFFISSMITESVIQKNFSNPLDHYLWQFALKEGKEMRGVETFDDQLRILQQIPIDYQIKAFKDLVSNVSTYRKKINHMNQWYENGNLNQLFISSKKSMGKLRNLMIYERNIVMADRIVQMSNEKASFFAIGAAHLPGEKGVIALLKRKGYQINPVK